MDMVTDKISLLRYKLMVSEPPATINEAVPLDMTGISVFMVVDARPTALDELKLWCKQEGLTIAKDPIDLHKVPYICHDDKPICWLTVGTGIDGKCVVGMVPLMTLPHMKYYNSNNGIFTFRPELINVSTE